MNHIQNFTSCSLHPVQKKTFSEVWKVLQKACKVWAVDADELLQRRQAKTNGNNMTQKGSSFQLLLWWHIAWETLIASEWRFISIGEAGMNMIVDIFKKCWENSLQSNSYLTTQQK